MAAFPSSTHVRRGDATRERVLKELERHSVLHSCCHGQVDNGHLIYLDGRIETRAYNDPDGVRRRATTIVVSRLHVHD